MISDLPDCLYEVKLIDCECESTYYDEYRIHISINYKQSSYDTYNSLSYRINISPYNGINIFSDNKYEKRVCTQCLKNIAVFYIMIIYPDAFESVDMGEYEYD